MDRESTSGGDRSPTEGRFVLNAIIGAVVGVVLGFVPLSPALGGIAAGYLQGGSRRDGMTVGAASGALAAIPALLVGVLFLVTAVFGGAGARGFVVVLVFLLAFLVFAGLYLVGLGAAGGWAGIYLRERGEGGREGRDELTPDDVDEAVADV